MNGNNPQTPHDIAVSEAKLLNDWLDKRNDKPEDQYPVIDKSDGTKVNVVVDTKQQGIIILHGGTTTLALDNGSDEGYGCPHLTPVERAVTVARLRAIADQIEAYRP